jgi:hypothetical protein
MKEHPMKFSLINIIEQSGLLVSGYWLQDHFGSLASTIQAAHDTEAANSNKINVAVVDAVSSPCAYLSYWRNLIQLDVDP